MHMTLEQGGQVNEVLVLLHDSQMSAPLPTGEEVSANCLGCPM